MAETLTGRDAATYRVDGKGTAEPVTELDIQIDASYGIAEQMVPKMRSGSHKSSFPKIETFRKVVKDASLEYQGMQRAGLEPILVLSPTAYPLEGWDTIIQGLPVVLPTDNLH